jgi:small subunit ribosomal protein S25e
MGGTKKKPLGASSKTAAAGPAGEAKPKEDSQPKKGQGGKPQQRQQKLSVLIEEPQGMKALQSMKAITIQGLAKSAGIKISVANAFIKSLEAKGVVKSIGGYSGHRVYEMVRR